MEFLQKCVYFKKLKQLLETFFRKYETSQITVYVETICPN